MLRRLFSIDHLLDWLLVFIPIFAYLRFTGADRLWIFISSAIAIVPLAGLMGQATEALASRAGPGVGGLLNASFGNAAELIIGFVALRAGQIDLVQASITGSIIGNLLFVLGLAALVGGTGREKQTFNRTAAGIGSSMLFLAVTALLVPTLLTPALERQGLAGAPLDAQLRTLSEAIAVVLLVVYFLKLVFSLKTHRHLYDEEAAAETEDEPHWGPGAAIAVLAIATLITAVAAESLVGAVEEAALRAGLSRTFIGVIVIAVVGNAAEHSTAVVVARKGKMGLAITISLESSLQVALFVAPVLVFASGLFWPQGRPMTLHFTDFEAFSVAIAVGSATLISLDGETNWLEGIQLLAVYAILAIALFFMKGEVR